MKRVMSQSSIEENIAKNRCPGLYFRTTATTCYSTEKRIETCTRCWKKYCIENGIEIEKER